MSGGGGGSDGRRKSITISHTGWGRKILVFMENYPVRL